MEEKGSPSNLQGRETIPTIHLDLGGGKPRTCFPLERRKAEKKRGGGRLLRKEKRTVTSK